MAPGDQVTTQNASGSSLAVGVFSPLGEEGPGFVLLSRDIPDISLRAFERLEAPTCRMNVPTFASPLPTDALNHPTFRVDASSFGLGG